MITTDRKYRGYSLGDITSYGTEQHTVWKALLVAVQQHGGMSADLDRLIDDAESEGCLVSEVAKMVVGRLWRYTEKPFNLGPVDFDCSVEEFADRYQRLGGMTSYRIHNKKDEQAWATTGPKSHCLYQLRHFREPKPYSDIFQELKGSEKSRLDHAGIRELITFASLLKQSDLGPNNELVTSRRVVAMGTVYRPTHVKTWGTSYSCVYAGGFTTLQVDPAIEKSAPYDFFLTRVYD